MMNTGLRKAAIFLSGLDWEMADNLLNRLDKNEAQTIRHEMVRLKNISEEEMTQTAQSFLQTTRSETAIYEHSIDRFECSSPVSHVHHVKIAPQELAEPEKTEIPQPHRFDFLEKWTPFETASLLVDEGPQIITVILSELDPQYSGEVILCFEQTFRMDIIHRLANLRETDEAILDEIEQSLKSRFSIDDETSNGQNRRNVIEEMLKYADEELEQEILAGLNKRQPAFSAEYGAALTFENLACFEDEELAALYRSINDEIAVLSLIGADGNFVSRVLYQYPVYEQPRIHQLFLQHQNASSEEILYARKCVLQGAVRLSGLITS